MVLASCEPTPTRPPDDAAAPSPSISETPTPTQSPKPVRRRLELVGHTNLGGAGFNADVWGFNGFAYVGIWGGVFQDADCPATGVKVVSLANPRKPRRVAVLRNPPGTTAEDMVVVRASTRHFEGDIAAVGIQPCNADEGSEAFRGLQLFDVTRPTRPKELGRWTAPARTIGCHEVDLIAVRRRVLAGCANGGAIQAGHDEAVFVDASNPRRPRVAGGFRAPVGTRVGVGCTPLSLVHNIRFARDGRTAYVSYWDHGTVLLDVRRPNRPRVLSRIRSSDRNGDGDNHSVGLAEPDLLLVNHEDFSPAPDDAAFEGCPGRYGGWGEMFVYDVSRPRKPRFVAKFGTRRSGRKIARGGGWYTVHNTEVVAGDQVFASWFADGIRWIDLSRPRRPQEVARFVPPARRDPHGFYPRATTVWGVKPLEGTDLILATDINSGLWVLRAIGLSEP